MPWTKAKTTCAIIIPVLLTVTIAIVLHAPFLWGANQRQYLDDGSLIVLNRLAVDSQIKIAHGTKAAKLLGNLVPSNGVHVLNFNLDRLTLESFDSGGKSWLVAEFRLTGTNAAKHPLVKPAFFRQFRFVIHGDSGTEFAEEIMENYSDQSA